MQVITQQFTIAKIYVPAVIGCNLLNKHKCTLDMGRGVKTRDIVQCTKESQNDSIFKIVLAVKFTVPPYSEILTQGKVVGYPMLEQ